MSVASQLPQLMHLLQHDYSLEGLLQFFETR